MSKPLLPMAIDVDGTLLKSDITQEMFWLGLIKFPWLAPKILYLIVTNRPALKAFLMPRLRDIFDPKHLPYNQDVLKRAKAHHEAGGEVILCSGSEHALIETIADHFDYIDAGFGTSETVNLVKGNKASFLEKRYPNGFIYFGNSTQDFKVWAAAHQAFAIRPPKGTEAVRTKIGEAVTILEQRTPEWGALLEAARISLIPFYLLAFMTIAYFWPSEGVRSLAIASLAFGFTVFGLCGLILLNDIADVAKDRQHPSKKYRPLSNGRLSATLSAVIGFSFLFVAIITIMTLPAPYPPISLATMALSVICLVILNIRK